MVKRRKRFNQCPNCNTMLKPSDRYCPSCGQENHDTNVSFGILFNEFVSTYLALDSSFIKTIKPFLLKPGFLTNKFNDGKRKSYANPVRLYLIVSIFYFFILSWSGIRIMRDDDQANNFKPVINYSSDNDTIQNSTASEDSLERELTRIALEEDGALWTKKKREKLKKTIEEYENKQKSEHSDTLVTDTLESAVRSEEKTQSDSTEESDSTSFILWRMDYDLVDSLEYDPDYTDKQLLDSMHLGPLKWWEEYLALQAIRLNRADNESFVGYLLQNLPLMMLIAIPVFALLLKLLYIRSKRLYVQHFIHALHLHSFAYLIYGIGLLLMVFVWQNETADTITWFLSITMVGIYCYISFLRVYRQHWLKTLIKYLTIGLSYSFLVFVFFLLEALISMLLY